MACNRKWVGASDDQNMKDEGNREFDHSQVVEMHDRDDANIKLGADASDSEVDMEIHDSLVICKQLDQPNQRNAVRTR
ncbi:hypothetical protein M5K25_015369 [Dendrobium thyrsiflorum]|uniref:Uncharacterized protein n=1 Tax=Dendrobium thyrsiflorum TaxID=117978 RepID=A0ABD0UQ37_DENTH